MNYEDIMKIHVQAGEFSNGFHLGKTNELSLEINSEGELIIREVIQKNSVIMTEDEAKDLRDRLNELFPYSDRPITGIREIAERMADQMNSEELRAKDEYEDADIVGAYDSFCKDGRRLLELINKEQS